MKQEQKSEQRRMALFISEAIRSITRTRGRAFSSRLESNYSRFYSRDGEGISRTASKRRDRQMFERKRVVGCLGEIRCHSSRATPSSIFFDRLRIEPLPKPSEIELTRFERRMSRTHVKDEPTEREQHHRPEFHGQLKAQQHAKHVKRLRPTATSRV